MNTATKAEVVREQSAEEGKTGEKAILGRPRLGRSMILKRALKKWDGKAWNGFIRLRIEAGLWAVEKNIEKNLLN